MSRFHDARQRAGAQAIIAALTATATYGTDAVDALLDSGLSETLDPLDAYDVAGGAAVVLGKIVDDVESVLGIDRDATLARLGAWVAAGELEETSP